MPENRKIVKRWDLLLFLPVYNKADGRVLGHVADITTEGLLLFSKEALPLQHDYALEIRYEDLEDSLIHQNLLPHPVHFIAQSRWHESEGALYRNGMMFLGLSPEAFRAVRTIVRNVARNFG